MCTEKVNTEGLSIQAFHSYIIFLHNFLVTFLLLHKEPRIHDFKDYHAAD